MRTWLLLFGFLSTVSFARAEGTLLVAALAPEQDVISYALASHRRGIFEDGMKMKAQEAGAFWKVYDEFEKESAKLDEEGLRLIGAYSKASPTSSNDELKTMIEDYVKLGERRLALRTKYFRILSDSLSLVVATRFFQIDDYLETSIKLGFLDQMPFLGDQAKVFTLKTLCRQ